MLSIMFVVATFYPAQGGETPILTEESRAPAHIWNGDDPLKGGPPVEPMPEVKPDYPKPRMIPEDIWP